jgi:hypothetical protein
VNDIDLEVEISFLVEQVRRLERAHVGRPRSADETERLKSIRVALDQRWDLVRQRRARRSAGQDPDGALVRPPQVVAGYRQ